MLALLLALVLSVSPASPEAVYAAPDGRPHCTTWTGVAHPPETIRVFVSHKRGSSIPAYVRTVPYREYVMTVMASGAWPAHLPYASLQAGAVAIKQYAAWHIRHPQKGYEWRHRCYDIRDGDQFYRPGTPINHKIRAAVDSTWHIWVRKNGRLFRTGWRGYAGRDGWHLFEDTVTRLARRGWGVHRILRSQLSPVRLVIKG